MSATTATPAAVGAPQPAAAAAAAPSGAAAGTAAAGTAPQRLQGTVHAWKQGYGFINCPGEVRAIFVHQSEIQMKGFRSLAPGQTVEFETEVKSDGRKQAIKVTGVNGAEPIGAPRELTQRNQTGRPGQAGTWGMPPAGHPYAPAANTQQWGMPAAAQYYGAQQGAWQQPGTQYDQTAAYGQQQGYAATAAAAAQPNAYGAAAQPAAAGYDQNAGQQAAAAPQYGAPGVAQQQPAAAAYGQAQPQYAQAAVAHQQPQAAYGQPAAAQPGYGAATQAAAAYGQPAATGQAAAARYQPY